MPENTREQALSEAPLNLVGAPRSATNAVLDGNHKRAAAINYLFRRRIGIERTIYLVKRRVSRSGETAIIQAFYINTEHDDLDAIGMYIALAIDCRYDQLTDGGGLIVRSGYGIHHETTVGRMMQFLGGVLDCDSLEWEWL